MDYKYSKTKICHIVYSFELGGIESLLVDLLNGLNTHKFELHLIVLTNDKVKMLPLLYNVTIHLMGYKSSEFKAIVKIPRVLKSLTTILSSIKPDIVHNHLASANYLLVTMAMRLSSITPVNIRTIHTIGSMYSIDKSYKDRLRFVIDKLAMEIYKPYLISISNPVYLNNINYFNSVMLGQKLIYNGVDLDKFNNYTDFSCKRFYGLEEKSIIVSYVARLEVGKNHSFLIDIWSEVVSEYPDAVLCLVGDGSLRSSIERKVIEKNIINNIVFLGAISNVEKLLSVSDFAVFPSSYEGFGIVMIEKLAMGLPVVASDITPFTEIATHGIDSFLIPLDNSREFIDSILLLLKNEDLRVKMGKQACIAAKKFDIKKTIELHEEYYLECLRK